MFPSGSGDRKFGGTGGERSCLLVDLGLAKERLHLGSRRSCWTGAGSRLDISVAGSTLNILDLVRRLVP